jgi:hypothetical protein
MPIHRFNISNGFAEELRKNHRLILVIFTQNKKYVHENWNKLLSDRRFPKKNLHSLTHILQLLEWQQIWTFLLRDESTLLTQNWFLRDSTDKNVIILRYQNDVKDGGSTTIKTIKKLLNASGTHVWPPFITRNFTNIALPTGQIIYLSNKLFRLSA